MRNPHQEEKNDEKFGLRLPKTLKDEIQRIAASEGLSTNSAIVQRLVWSMKYRDGINGQ